MEDARERRAECRRLADQLIVEYAGALPPGQVLAAVFRAYRSLSGPPGLTPAVRMDICETFARRQLTDQVSAQVSAQGAGRERAATRTA